MSKIYRCNMCGKTDIVRTGYFWHKKSRSQADEFDFCSICAEAVCRVVKRITKEKRQEIN